nr:LacI family DNA-binding transcriptional regulator [Propionicimonas sp.]
MSGRRPTQADVARLAGVSRQLVSLALHGDPRVSPERRGAIQRAMDELGYRTNAAARQLASSRSDMIGVVLPAFANVFYGELAEALRNEGEERGLVPLLASISENASREVSAVERFLELQVSGLILVAPLLDMAALKDYGALVPTVVVTRDRAPETVDLVRFEDRANARTLTEHLLAKGYDPVVFVGYERPPAEGDSAWERQQGYRDAMRAAGKPPATFAAPGFGASNAPIAGLDEILRPGLGIVCHNDQLAIMVAGRVDAAGLRRGKEVGLAGFDNIRLTHTLGTSLTTVALDVAAIARTATELLEQRNNGRSEPEVVTMPAELIERASTSGYQPKRRWRLLDGRAGA